MRHSAEHIVGVGVGDVATETASVLRGVGGEVGSATDIAEAEVGRGDAHIHSLLAERGGCQTAELREVETAAHSVVILDAVDVSGAVLRGIAAETESHHAEVVVGGLVIDIVDSTLDGTDRLALALVLEDLRLIKDVVVATKSGVSLRHCHLYSS